MLLIPYRRFWITSSLTEDEVERRISAHVDLTLPYGFFAIYDHKYGGSVSPKGFSLKRGGHYRATISIEVEWHETGSRVGVIIAAPEFAGLLVLIPVVVAVATAQLGYLAGAPSL